MRDWRAMLARLKAGARRTGGQSAARRRYHRRSRLSRLAGRQSFHLPGRARLSPGGSRQRRWRRPWPPGPDDDSGLGVLSDPRGARDPQAAAERPALTGAVRAFLDEPEPLIVTKSISRSFVHRRTHMDYIGVKIFGRRWRLHRRAPLCRPVHLRRLQPVAARHSPAAQEDRGGDGARRLWRPPAMTARRWPISWTLSPATNCSRFRKTNCSTPRWASCSWAAGPRSSCSCASTVSTVSFRRCCYAPRDHMNPEVRERIHAILARAFNGRTSASDAGAG